MTGLNKEEWEDILPKLPAHEIYEEFNNLQDDEYCKTYFQEALNLEGKYPEIKNICENFAGIMKKLKNHSTDTSYIAERCKFLNFWLYDKISENFKNNMGDKFNYEIVWPFIQGWSKINTKFLNNYCSYRYVPNARLDDLNDYKHIYDYTKNQAQIDQNNFADIKECNKYYNYVSYINEIYEKHMDRCCEQSDPTCKRFFFDCDKKYIPKKHMDQLKCDKLQKSNEQLDGFESKIAEPQLETDDSSSQSRVINELDPDTPTAPKSKAVMSVTFPIIGIFFIYSLIHKFTPLGSWLHNKVLGNKIKLTNQIQEEYHHDFLENVPITTDANLQNDLYNIAYNQV